MATLYSILMGNMWQIMKKSYNERQWWYQCLKSQIKSWKTENMLMKEYGYVMVMRERKYESSL